MKGTSLRRILGMMLLVSSLALVAAAPTPAPSPAPLATPSAPPPALGQNPTVLIYPFDVQGTDPKAGAAIAQILAQEMTAAGDINVLQIPTGVARPAFLEYARSQHADYYVSGYVTPVGDSAAVVSQVVSVESGVILFSQTAQVSSVADVASQALQARANILAISGRGTQNIATQSATPAPTSTNGAQMQIKGIGGIVDSVFGKHPKPTPTPSPAPITKPPRAVIVAPASASGAVEPSDLTNATSELYFAMGKFFNVSMTGPTPSIKKSADAICGTNRDNTIATGILGSQPQKHGREYTFTLQIYTCFGVLLDGEIGKGSSLKAAVDSAVATYAKGHPDNS